MKNFKYHVAHILVKAQYEAEDLLLKLNSGHSFEELARKYSLCSSAKNNGDLGFIRNGKAVEEFEVASIKLKVGEITKAPIRTPFGYHLIKRLG